MQSSVPHSPTFEALVRVFSSLSLVAALGALLVRFLPPERGVQFGTHLLLALGLIVQITLLLLFSGIAIFLRISGGFQWSRFSTYLSVLALLGLAGQWYALQTMSINSSSIP